MPNVTMTYGGYNFTPVPLLNLTREYKKTEDGRNLSVVTKATLDGNLISTNGSVSELTLLKNTLASGLEKNGCAFSLECNGSPLLQMRPRLIGLSFKNSNNNWVNTVGYSVELEYDEFSGTGEIGGATYLDSVSEQWDIEPIDDKPYFSWTAGETVDSHPYLYKLTHQLSAKGKSVYSDCGEPIKEGWEYAAAFVSGKLGTSNLSNPIMGLPSAGYDYYNYNRTQSLQKFAGSYSVNENWVVFKSGEGVPGAATEDFSIDIKTNYESDMVNVTVQGSVQGLETSTYDTANVISKNISVSKYAAASGYFNNIVGRLYSRAQQAFTDANLGTTRVSLNPLNINKSIGYNIANGTISYTYEYTNKPTVCIAGALNENIVFNIDYPTDVAVPIPIIGRSAGPLIQLMGTRTAYQYRMGIDVVVPIISGCGTGNWDITKNGCPHNSVKTYLAEMETNLSGVYGQLIKTQDQITWNPKEGKYSRAVTWMASPCAGGGTAVHDL